MPKSDWKKDFGKVKIVDNREKPQKVVKQKKEPKKTPLKKPTKPIKQIGERKKRRISEYGTESDHFRRVWEARVEHGDIWCEVCGEEVREPFVQNSETGKWNIVKPQCFAHKLAKGMYEKFRYLEQNIGLVCSIKCHNEQDKLLNDPMIRKNMEDEFDLLLTEYKHDG